MMMTYSLMSYLLSGIVIILRSTIFALPKPWTTVKLAETPNIECDGVLSTIPNQTCLYNARKKLESQKIPHHLIEPEIQRHCFYQRTHLCETTPAPTTTTLAFVATSTEATAESTTSKPRSSTIPIPTSPKSTPQSSTIPTSTNSNPSTTITTSRSANLLRSSESTTRSSESTTTTDKPLLSTTVKPNILSDSSSSSLTPVLKPIETKGIAFLPETDVQVTNTFWKLFLDVPLIPKCKKLQELEENIKNKLLSFDSPSLSLEDDRVVTDSFHFSLNLVKDASLICDTITETHVKTRIKRAAPLELGSQILQFVFGVARQQDVSTIQVDLNNVNKVLQNITIASQEQLTILNQTWTRLDRQEQSLATLARTLSKVEKRESEMTSIIQSTFKKEMHVLLEKASYDRLMTAIQNLALEYSQQMNQLDSILISASNQRLSRHLISPAQLNKILRSVQNRLPNGMKLFVPPEHSYVYYDEATTHVLANENGFAFLIKLPLQTTNSAFQLFSTNSLPSRLANTTLSAYIYNVAPFFGITEGRTHYIEMSHTDYARCSSGILKTCPISTAIKPINQVSCLSALYTGNSKGVHDLCPKMIIKEASPVAIRYPSGHSWLIFLPFDLDLHISCLQNHRFKVRMSNAAAGTYQLNLPSKCKLDSTFFSIPLSFQGSTDIQWGSFSDTPLQRQPIATLFSSFQEDIIRTLNMDQPNEAAEIPPEDTTHAVFNSTFSVYGNRPANFDHIAAILKSTNANLLQDKNLLVHHFQTQSTWITVAICLFLVLALIGLFVCVQKFKRILARTPAVPPIGAIEEQIPLQGVAFPRPP